MTMHISLNQFPMFLYANHSLPVGPWEKQQWFEALMPLLDVAEGSGL